MKHSCQSAPAAWMVGASPTMTEESVAPIARWPADRELSP